MEIKIYQPYLKYETRFFLKKERDLNEMEALIFLAIKFSDNVKSKNLIEFLCQKLNLDKDKWQYFIIHILKESLKSGEISIENKKENPKWKELLVGEIELHEIISKNLENSHFKGLESKDIIKDQKIYIGLWNRNDLQKDIDSKQAKIIDDDIPGLIKSAKQQNNEDIINEQGENLLHNAVLFKKEFSNQEEIDQYKNILFLPTQTFDFEIKNNRIVNTDLAFYKIIESYQECQISDFLKSQLEKHFSTKIKLREIEEMNQSDVLNSEYQKIDDFNAYQSMIDTRNNFGKSFKVDSDPNVFFYKNDFIILKQKRESLTLNTSEIKIDIPFLFYKKAQINIKDFVKFNIENKGLLKIWEKMEDQNLKAQFKTELLNNLITFFSISQDNKQWVIQNINEAQNIDKDWLFSFQVSYEDFTNMFLQPNNQNLLEAIKTDYRVLDFDHHQSWNIEKVNWLYDQFKIDFHNLKIYSKQLDIYDPVMNSKYDPNNLDSVQNLIKQINETVNKIKIKSLETKLRSKLNELKEIKDELVQKSKETIIDEIFKICNDKLKGVIDKYLEKLTGLKNQINKKMLDHIKDNKLVDDQTYKDLEWLNDKRNNYAHSENKNIRTKLFQKDLNVLQKEYEELNSKVKIINKEN